jgi:hypothetical protein
MTPWNYIVICLSLVLLVLLLIREVKRENRARLQWRIAADILLAAALAAIALPIGYTRQSGQEEKEGVLLTEGYLPDSVRPYQGSKTMSIFTSVEEMKGQALTALHVLGYGLTREQCDSLPQAPVIFHPPPARAGIVSIHWKQSLWPGEICRIQGRCHPPAGAGMRLLLTGMHTILDSAEAGSGDFELRTVPLQSGRAVYQLIVLSGRDTVEQESIPVEVLPGKNLKILMLAAAPDFENRFLASWLSDKGHGVVIRTAISKGKYDHAYLNMAETAPDHLTPRLLDKFDIVIADAAELKAMSSAEYSGLRRQVAEKGLGLIVKTDSTSLGHGVRAVGGRDSMLRMVITDKPGSRPLMRDSLSRTLVSASMYGSGVIILTTLTETYVRLLAGDKKAYASLWTAVLQQAAGKAGPAERWQCSPELPAVHQPVRMMLQSADGRLPQGLVEEEGGDSTRPVAVYLAQHRLLPFAWEGSFWPGTAGWKTVRTSEGARTWWYVWEEGDWRNLHRAERVLETQRWIAQAGKRDIRQGGGEIERDKVLINKGWFALLFLICCLFIWVERKI